MLKRITAGNKQGVGKTNDAKFRRGFAKVRKVFLSGSQRKTAQLTVCFPFSILNWPKPIIAYQKAYESVKASQSFLARRLPAEQAW